MRNKGRAQNEQDKMPIDQREDTRIELGTSESEMETRIRRRIEKRRQDREAFLYHLVGFIGTNAVLWGIWAFSPGRGAGLPWQAGVTACWGIALVSHAIFVYQNSSMAVARRESAVQREIELEKARVEQQDDDYDYVQDKPKRTLKTAKPASVEPEQQVRLSDDGELVPVDADEPSNRAPDVNRQFHSMRRASDDE